MELKRMKNNVYATIFLSNFALLLFGGSAEQCGWQAGGAVCPNGLCCSQYGWCGTVKAYCAEGCQSQCRRRSTPTPIRGGGGGGGGGGGYIGWLISEDTFNQMFKHRNEPDCKNNGIYNYQAFLTAAQSFNGFATTGDESTRKRELAAFFGQTSKETTGGWDTAPDGPYAWGYCFARQIDQSSYCSPSWEWPCAPNQQYYGRGPIQISYNYNYGQAGRALGLDLLNNPDLVATDAVVAFKTAIWFWMTPQGNKPSSHDVITGRWQPSDSDRDSGRYPGYGVITNIINGGVECGGGYNDAVNGRIEFYKRYCDMLGVRYGDNLDCYHQSSFA